MRRILASVSVISTLLYGDVSQAMNVKEWLTAAKQGDVAKMKSMINNGIDINIREYWGDTALISSAARGYTEVVRLLLANGADVNLQDKDGKTAMDKADKEEIRSLLERSKLENEISKLSVN